MYIIYDSKKSFDNNWLAIWLKSVHAACWPCGLVQHKKLIEMKALNKELRFYWEYENIAYLLKSPPPRKDYLYVLVGPSGGGKTELFKKLVGASLGTHNTERRDRSVRIGYRSILVNTSQLSFLELWDVPTSELVSVERSLADAHGVVLVFDATDQDSFEDMKIIHKKISCLHQSMTFICVAMKKDLLVSQDIPPRVGNAIFEPKIDALSSAFSRQIRDIAENWAQDMGIQFFDVSKVTNEGILQLLRHLDFLNIQHNENTKL